MGKKSETRINRIESFCMGNMTIRRIYREICGLANIGIFLDVRLGKWYEIQCFKSK